MIQIKNILCVIELDKNSEATLKQAVKLAKDHQAKLTVASVLEMTGALHSFFKNKQEISEKLKDLTANKRDEIQALIKKHGAKMSIEIELYTGIGFIEIVKNVIKNSFDLVVKCADDIDWLPRLFASEDMQLLRKCPCPVLMLKPGAKDVFQNVLATVDVNDDFIELDETRVQSQLNKKVLQYSALFSVSESTNLHIGSVWKAYGEDFLRSGAFTHLPDEKVDVYSEQARRECSYKLDTLVRELNSLVGKDTVDYLNPKSHLVKGEPSQEIPLLIKKYDVDLIVMGTVARTGISGFIIGNTAESILEQVHCSVLAIKPDGFETTIEV